MSADAVSSALRLASSFFLSASRACADSDEDVADELGRKDERDEGRDEPDGRSMAREGEAKRRVGVGVVTRLGLMRWSRLAALASATALAAAHSQANYTLYSNYASDVSSPNCARWAVSNTREQALAPRTRPIGLHYNSRD